MERHYNIPYFTSKTWSFAVIKNEKIVYRSKKQGLRPLIFCLQYKKDTLRGATVYDKIIGRAAACLLIEAGVKKVMTPAVSQKAVFLLNNYGVKIEYEKIIKQIMNRQHNDQCPMEKLSKNKTPANFTRLILGRLPTKH